MTALPFKADIGKGAQFAAALLSWIKALPMPEALEISKLLPMLTT
jgi:hypothetical protein